MKHATETKKTIQTNMHSTCPNASAGTKGVAIAPPAYGRDIVDSQPVQAMSEPIQEYQLLDSPTLLARDGLIQRKAALSGAEKALHREAKENKTGLPDNLKAGIENLSGLSMDDVRVHYNSSKPAKLQALAYTQGTDIHVGQGEEKHLPHEAWHVVQQRQGRVKPTMQMSGEQINDEVGLEREADVMGEKALQRTGGFRSRSTHPTLATQRKQVHTSKVAVVQRSTLTEKESDGPFDSPFTKLQKELPGVNLFLSSVSSTNTNDPSSAQATYKRPKKVEATIQGPRRTTGTRRPSGVPASVGNLGNQELLIRDKIRQQTYQGGHLIGDELLPKTIDSMVDWNLAPQNSDFNHPVYFGLVEEVIFRGPINPTTGIPDLTIPVDVKVKLTYPQSTYQVSVQDLINNGVVAQSDITAKGISHTTNITLENRVPTKWDIEATISGGSGKFTRQQLTANQTKAVVPQQSITTPLSHTDFLVSSPHLQTVGSNMMIGGGPDLKLLGRQGDTDPTNTNPVLSGVMPTLSAPPYVPPPIFNPPMEMNTELKNHLGDLPNTITSKFLSLPGVAKIHVDKLKCRIKRRYRLRRTPYTKTFTNHNDFISLCEAVIPKTAHGKALLHPLKLDSSIDYI